MKRFLAILLTLTLLVSLAAPVDAFAASKKKSSKKLVYILTIDNDGVRVRTDPSGGKDSLVLLYALSLYRKFCANSFELSAVTLGMGLSPVDFSPVAELCQRLEVPYTLRETDIGDVMLCCGITPEEFSEIYKAKCERNKNRW